MLCPRKKLKSHSTSPTLSSTTNSDPMVELVIHLYFKDFYDMGRPPIVNT